MVQEIILGIILLWASFLIAVLVHEIGHLGRKIKFTSYILPSAYSIDCKSRYGGLIANALIAGLIFWYRPESLFIQLIGLANFTHLVLYLIIGGFNRDIRGTVKGIMVLDDIPNKQWHFALITAFVTILIMGSFYKNIIWGLFI